MNKPISPAKLLRDFGIEEPADIDIEAIAEACGATVMYKLLKGSAARIIGRGNRAIITVHSDAPRERQRFSAAHELGHWTYDRGTVAFACSSRMFATEWEADNPERRANRFAADLLLPEFMFHPRARGRDMLLKTAKGLADEFRTSLTATVLRLVQFGSAPAMAICTDPGGRKWFYPGPDVPKNLFPRDQPTSDSIAYDLHHGRPTESPQDVSVAAWFSSPQAEKYSVCEDSFKFGDLVITLLWWRDESHLLEHSGLRR